MSEFNMNLSDFEDDDFQEENAQDLSNQREAVVFLVDGGVDMFVKDHEDETPFETCLKCAKSVMQSKIISNEKDLISIIFYATEKSTNEEDFKHIFVFQELEQPGAQKILQLEKLLDTFETDNTPSHGHSSNYLLSDALWTCLNVFNKCTMKLRSKRILLFSNNDNPHPDNTQQLKQCKSKVEDLRQNGVELVLMHINKPDHPFTVSLFYKELLLEGEGDELPDASERFEELLTRVRMKSHKRRMLQHIPFFLDPQLSISVGVYNMCYPCKKSAPVKLHKKDNQEVTSQSTTCVKETGEEIEKGELRKGMKLAGRTMVFTDQEVSSIKHFKAPGLYLLGFKDKSCLKTHYHIKPAQFIYPDEKSANGSTCLFSSLLSGCLEKGVVVVCEYVPRKNAPPKLVLLCPQNEDLDNTRIQVTPPGFHLTYLPFKEDVRELAIDATVPKANKHEIEKAKELVKKLQFQFSCESFENPYLQQYYSCLEAMALERENPEDNTDFTEPDEEKIEKRAGRLMRELKEMVEGRCEPPKRSSTITRDTDLDIEFEAREGRLSKLTVPVLRGWLKRLDIKLEGGRKADLIDAINNHYSL